MMHHSALRRAWWATASVIERLGRILWHASPSRAALRALPRSPSEARCRYPGRRLPSAFGRSAGSVPGSCQFSTFVCPDVLEGIRRSTRHGDRSSDAASACGDPRRTAATCLLRREYGTRGYRASRTPPWARRRGGPCPCSARAVSCSVTTWPNPLCDGNRTSGPPFSVQLRHKRACVTARGHALPAHFDATFGHREGSVLGGVGG